MDAAESLQSLSLTKDNTSSEAVSLRVLNTYELLEHILCDLPMKDLLRSKLVCKTWHNTVKRSTTLRKNLFLISKVQGTTITSAKRWKTPFSRVIVVTGSPALEPHPWVDSKFETDENVLWMSKLQRKDWEQMLTRRRGILTHMSVTWPATARVEIFAIIGTKLGLPGHSFPHPKFICSDAGITVAQLLDTINLFFQESMCEGNGRWNHEILLRGYAKGAFGPTLYSTLSFPLSRTAQPLRSNQTCCKVLLTYDLVENILLRAVHLQAHDLVRYQRVSRVWKAVISGSQPLRQRLFLQPVFTQSQVKLFWPNSYITHRSFWQPHPLISKQTLYAHWRHNDYKWDVTLEKRAFDQIFRKCAKGEWPTSLIVQPPVEKVVIWSLNFVDGIYNNREVIHKAGGIDLRALVQGIMRCEKKDVLRVQVGTRGWNIRAL